MEKMNIYQYFKSFEMGTNTLVSILLILAVIIGRRVLMKKVRSSKVSDPDIKRQWIVQIKNISALILVLGMVLIWATKLHAFALSVVAIAAALVIATKELLACLLGGFLKVATSMFKIGDRIEILGNRGDVISQNFFTTTIMEVGPGRLSHQYTGKKIILPNSYFLLHPLSTDTRTDKFRLHTFTVTCPREINILRHQKVLLESAQKVCGEYEVLAKKYLKSVEKFEGIEAPSTASRVHISLNDHSSVDFVVRVPIPALKSTNVEQEIVSTYLLKIGTEKSQGIEPEEL